MSDTEGLPPPTLAVDGQPPRSHTGVSDALVVGFRRVVTRRRFLASSLRWLFGAGTVVAVGLGRPSTALASNCNVYGNQSTWGGLCAPTATCGACASLGRCYFDRRRCNAWSIGNSEGQYCWCSERSYHGACYGRYVCCDCWMSTPTSCDNRPNPCICSHKHCE